MWCLGEKNKIRQMHLNLTGECVSGSLLFPSAHLLLALPHSAAVHHTAHCESAPWWHFPLEAFVPTSPVWEECKMTAQIPHRSWAVWARARLNRSANFIYCWEENCLDHGRYQWAWSYGLVTWAMRLWVLSRAVPAVSTTGIYSLQMGFSRCHTALLRSEGTARGVL